MTYPAIIGIDAAWTATEPGGVALVCAWMGIRYLNGGAKPYGDSNAAIWAP